MTTPLVIVGAGGLGREILDIIEAMNAVMPTYSFLGFLDDSLARSDEVDRRNARVIGTSADIASLNALYLLGIGDGKSRAKLDEVLSRMGYAPGRAVHPAATIGTDVDMGEGLLMAAGARITTNVRSGRHVYLSVNSTIAHDCRVGSYVTILPGASVSGNVIVEDGVTVGASAVILPGLRVGAYSIIGAGAVVLHDVAPGATVVGVPARSIRAGTKA